MALAIQPDLPGKYPNLYNIPNLYTKKKQSKSTPRYAGRIIKRRVVNMTLMRTNKIFKQTGHNQTVNNYVHLKTFLIKLDITNKNQLIQKIVSI